MGVGHVCGDAIESLNAMLKRAYNDHTAQTGGRGDGGGNNIGM